MDDHAAIEAFYKVWTRLVFALPKADMMQDKDNSKYDKALAQTLDTILAKAAYIEVGEFFDQLGIFYDDWGQRSAEDLSSWLRVV